ncbi:MAG: hypothetical protein OXI86_16405 [Candidatus Poribacteria bacterium]|nr:hypothetical protein [Candidatus Poribacteria bacterium]
MPDALATVCHGAAVGFAFFAIATFAVHGVAYLVKFVLWLVA